MLYHALLIFLLSTSIIIPNSNTSEDLSLMSCDDDIQGGELIECGLCSNVAIYLDIENGNVVGYCGDCYDLDFDFEFEEFDDELEDDIVTSNKLSSIQAVSSSK